MRMKERIKKVLKIGGDTSPPKFMYPPFVQSNHSKKSLKELLFSESFSLELSVRSSLILAIFILTGIYVLVGGSPSELAELVIPLLNVFMRV